MVQLQDRSFSPKPIKYGPLWALLILFVSGVTGCGSAKMKQAKDLATMGSQTSNQLSSYYSTLAQDRIDYLSMFEFDLAQTGAAPQEPLVAAFNTQIGALQSRAVLAERLRAGYDALGKLISYDAAGQVETAGKGLQAAIEDADHHPLSVPGGKDVSADVNKYWADALGLIVQVVQIRDFRQKAALVRNVLADVDKVYEAEKSIYIQIAQDYDKETEHVARYVIDHNEAAQAPAFDRYIQVYGLQAKEPSGPDTNVQSWLKFRIMEQARQRAAADQAAADALSTSMDILLAAHDDFAGKKLSNSGTRRGTGHNSGRIAC